MFVDYLWFSVNSSYWISDTIETCEIAVQMEQLHSTNKTDQYRSGFLECITETVQFIGHHQADHHGPFYAGEEFCSRLVAHLHNHYEKIGRGMLHIVLVLPLVVWVQKQKRERENFSCFAVVFPFTCNARGKKYLLKQNAYPFHGRVQV